jgi:hypothetical protein
MSLITQLWFILSRHTHQSSSNYGQVCVRLVRTVQLGDSARWSGGRYQQEAVAGDHQGPASAVQYHKCSVYVKNTVSNRDTFVEIVDLSNKLTKNGAQKSKRRSTKHIIIYPSIGVWCNVCVHQINQTNID